MLFNEPKLLKFLTQLLKRAFQIGFSALQRAEIAEIRDGGANVSKSARSFSALQRAEIAEIHTVCRMSI